MLSGVQCGGPECDFVRDEDYSVPLAGYEAQAISELSCPAVTKVTARRYVDAEIMM